jgi:ribosome-binding protein aMBF1 (putative translation factor)
MSQTDKKRRRLAMAIGESFAAIRRRTARSQAWLSLSAPAMKIYIELKLRWRHKDDNNGQLFVSIAECKSLLGIAPGTAHRALRELQDKSFIIMTRRGEAGKLNAAVLDNGGYGFSRRATTWALTEEPYRGRAATHAYEKWTPEAQKQIRGSTIGTRRVPPVERKAADSSTSGTYSPVFEAPHGSTNGIPVSTICRERSGSLPNPQSQESAHPKIADPSARLDGVQESPKRRPWRKPRILEEQGRSLPDFGTWMRNERERLGLSLDDIGVVMRMKPESIARLEANRAKLGTRDRKKLRALFETRDRERHGASMLAALEALDTSDRKPS